jgi:NTP pyrophosphatase (non-canonical NTP hydrolase)
MSDTQEGTLTLAGVQSLIRERYFATDSARGASGTFLLFMEEIGELATALHEHRPGADPSAEQTANLAEEFADVLAWLTTLANIHDVDLTEAMSKYTDPDRVKGVKGV